MKHTDDGWELVLNRLDARSNVRPPKEVGVVASRLMLAWCAWFFVLPAPAALVLVLAAIVALVVGLIALFIVNYI